jgi:hypothetical protein
LRPPDIWHAPVDNLTRERPKFSVIRDNTPAVPFVGFNKFLIPMLDDEHCAIAKKTTKRTGNSCLQMLSVAAPTNTATSKKTATPSRPIHSRNRCIFCEKVRTIFLRYKA